MSELPADHPTTVAAQGVALGSIEPANRLNATHIMIARAVDGPDGRAIEVRVGVVGFPAPDSVRELRENIAASYRTAFGDEPTSIAVAVLPYSRTLDQEDDDAV